MKSLVWKELRENLKWALMAMVALGMAEMHALYNMQNSWEADVYHNHGITLCKTEFLMVTTFGSAAVGLLLGLLQILPELRRDQWAALLHRPVSRDVIFRGKVLAGLLLYSLAVLPPFLLSVLLVATPGHFASPFVTGMVLPGAADIGAGCVYYFAAVVIALQRDKWIGLKAFPLLAAFHVSHFATSTGLFYVSAEAVLLMALTLLVAGWATMLHQEKLDARPWIGKVAFLAMVFYGACGLGDLAKSVGDAVGPSVHYQRVEYELSDRGVPLRITYNDDVPVSVTTVDGKPLSETQYSPAQIRSHVLYMSGISSYIGNAHGWHPWVYHPDYRDTNSYVSHLSAYNYPRFEQWFMLTKERSFVCYLVGQRKFVARLDSRGFQPTSVEPQSLPSKTEWRQFGDHLILWSGNHASFLSLPLRGQTDLPLPEEGPIFGVGGASFSTRDGSESIFALALSDEMAVYDNNGILTATLPYDQDMDRWGKLEMGLIGVGDRVNRFYLKYNPSPWIDGKIRDGMPSYLEEMDAHGKVLQTYMMSSRPRDTKTTNWMDFIAERLQSPAFFFGGLGYQKIGALFGSKRLSNDLAWRLGHDFRQTQEIGLCVACLSVMLAGITLFWARRALLPWRRAWAWTVFVLFFNVGGFITFRLASDWPLRVLCPFCRRSRPIHEEACPNCGAGWPAPEREGTEIFDRPMLPIGAETDL